MIRYDLPAIDFVRAAPERYECLMRNQGTLSVGARKD